IVLGPVTAATGGSTTIRPPARFGSPPVTREPGASTTTFPARRRASRQGRVFQRPAIVEGMASPSSPTPPANAPIRAFSVDDGASLRWRRVPVAGASALILLLGGRGEPLEKYAEV